MTDFTMLNPYTSVIYFLCVIYFSTVFTHPVFVVVNVVASFTACLCICRREILSLAKYTFATALLITIVNPLFSTKGRTVLFSVFGRPYTKEAMLYGAVLAGIFLCSVHWFCALGKIFTSEKLNYILAGKLPVICIMLSTILGLIPYFTQKLIEIDEVHSKLSPENGGKIKGYAKAFLVASDYAFEHAINIAVSMKNRGFGTGKQSRYLNFKFTAIDFTIIAMSIILSVLCVFCAYNVAITTSFIPVVKLMPMGMEEIAGLGAYILLIFIPLLMKVIYEIKWKFLMSKI